MGKHYDAPPQGWRKANNREREAYGVLYVKKNKKRKVDPQQATQAERQQQEPEQEEADPLELLSEPDAPFLDTGSDEEEPIPPPLHPSPPLARMMACLA